jgi:hypothetical protein
MLIPALMPLCLGSGAAQKITASGSLMLAFAAVGVHTAAMIAVTGAMAFAVCRGFHPGVGLLRKLGRKGFRNIFAIRRTFSTGHS